MQCTPRADTPGVCGQMCAWTSTLLHWQQWICQCHRKLWSRPQCCDNLLLCWVPQWMILWLASVATVLWMTRPCSPSPLCVLESCTSNLAKCLFSSSCRDGVMCEMKCTEPLAKTEEAVHFAGFMECMRVHCPGFPPSKSCAALHCGVEAASCAVHSACRHTMECADKCVPDKYTAALAAMDLPVPQKLWSRPQCCDNLLLCWVPQWMILWLASVATVLWMTRPCSPAHCVCWKVALAT